MQITLATKLTQLGFGDRSEEEMNVERMMEAQPQLDEADAAAMEAQRLLDQANAAALPDSDGDD